VSCGISIYDGSIVYIANVTICLNFQDDEGVNCKTMVAQDMGTLVPSRDLDSTDSGTLVQGTLVQGTLVPGSQCGTMVELQSDLGTMVINSDTDDDSTMKSKSVSIFFQFQVRPFLLSLFVAVKGTTPVRENLGRGIGRCFWTISIRRRLELMYR